jgi:hypothetical protein
MTKTLKNIRERLSKKRLPGDTVYTKKIGKNELMIKKIKNEFVVFIDNEKLDSYKNQREAERMGKEFLKQYKG